MKTKSLFALLTVAVALLTSSCALMRQSVVVAPVESVFDSQPALVSIGFLKVCAGCAVGPEENGL